MKNYNILRIKKIKTRQKITQVASHNLRTRTQRNIDKSRSFLNEILINSLDASKFDSTDLQKKLTKYYENLEVKEKTNNVLLLEFVVSASPDFFKSKNIDEVKQWAASQVEFFKKEFGEQVKHAVLHLDEKSPHIHFLVSTEQRTTKRYKNQFGEFHKETYSLNAKRYNKEFLIELHTRHAEHNKPYGLKRGERGSSRKHKTLKEFYADADLHAAKKKNIENKKAYLKSILEMKPTYENRIKELEEENRKLKAKYSLK